MRQLTLQNAEAEFVILQYSDGTWYDDAVASRMSLYCILHGCEHVLVAGSCGLSVKPCKQIVYAASALAFDKPTIFVDNDVLIEELMVNAEPDLCSNFLNIGCRFDQVDLPPKRRMNSGIMCIRPDLAPGGAAGMAEYVNTVVDVGKCLDRTRSDQYAFRMVFESAWRDGRVGCTDETLYGSDKSSRWRHYWGADGRASLPNATTYNHARHPGTSSKLVLNGSRIVERHLITHDGKTAVRITPMDAPLYEPGTPATERVRAIRSFIDHAPDVMVAPCAVALTHKGATKAATQGRPSP
jgi:hypothetical protein